jgi:hypothetical protein
MKFPPRFLPTLTLVVVTLLGSGAGTGLALAQPPAGGRVEPASPNPRRAARRERVRQRIRAMRAWYLTEQLDLDDAAAGRLFPLLGQFDDRLDELHRRGVQLRRSLRRAMAAARPDPAALDRTTDALLAHYEALYRIQRERFAAVRRVITPAQSARLLLLLPRIDDAIRRQIQRAMRGQGARRKAGPARRRRGPDELDDLDDDGAAGGDPDDLDDPLPFGSGRRKNRVRGPRGPAGEPGAAPFADPF